MLCLACLGGFAMPSSADETLAVVTQKSSPLQNLSLDALKRVYLRKSLLDSEGKRWILLNLPVDHELRQGFSLALFKKLPEDQEQYWNELYFQGVSPPEVLASEEAVLRFIAITPGAIGYVRKQSVDERVKILTVIAIPER
jgi:hypothetical protein